MTSCSHKTLMLLPERKNVLRCQHCHLTIKADELGQGHCPECFEMNGRRRFDFEEMAEGERGRTRYRCEECGAIIESS